MKTAMELREMLKVVFDRATKELERKAEAQCPEEMDAETLAIHNKVMTDLNDLIHGVLNKDILYCTPNDDFYPALAQLMLHPLYRTYDTYAIAPDVTDKQILAHRKAIESGNLKALAALRQKPAKKKWVAPILGAFHDRRRMFNNLYYYLYVMAHQAKHYDSRLAGHNFLRAASIARKGLKRLPQNLTDDAAHELVSLVQEGAEELMVAADYHALPDWEPFQAAEAKKLADEEAKLAAEEAKRTEETKGQEGK